jgi:hypothetical protein
MARPKGGSAKMGNVGELPHGDSKDALNELIENNDGIRDAIQNMLVGNLDNLTIWLKNIGDNDPKKALDIFRDFSEYILPKQQRTDPKLTSQQPIIINFEPSSNAALPQQKTMDNITEAPQLKRNIIDEVTRRN